MAFWQETALVAEDWPASKERRLGAQRPRIGDGNEPVVWDLRLHTILTLARERTS